MMNEKREVLDVLYVGINPAMINNIQEAEDFFRIDFAANSIDAVKKLEKKPDFDAILCEYNLPGMKGYQLYRFLKGNIQKTLAPFILLSHKETEKAPGNILSEGIDDLYHFPLDAEILFERICFLKKRKADFSGKSNTTQEQIYKTPLIKRLFDIAVAGFALLLLSPFLLIIIALIRLESKGKVYYISKRVGTGYKIFDFYKLRSMHTGADAQLKELNKQNQYSQDSGDEESEEICLECKKLGHPCSNILVEDGQEICEALYLKRKKKKQEATFVKIKDDPRVTRLGKFIRNTSIDEVPQLINVLKGDMSIVGNRPLPLYEAELLTNDQWSERFLAPAGITGLWQVMKRGKSGQMSPEERKDLDNQYARNSSFWWDIKIIFLTFRALFQKENV
jgi:lipopolysaccharide/colanic/teichoic acid biosynthesis glycosyltransferase